MLGRLEHAIGWGHLYYGDQLVNHHFVIVASVVIILHEDAVVLRQHASIHTLLAFLGFRQTESNFERRLARWVVQIWLEKVSDSG